MDDRTLLLADETAQALAGTPFEHAVGGVTRRDVELAQRIHALASE